jgi:hypothetical protein
MRNKKLYQLSIYRKKRGNKKLVFHLRDSYTQLPNSLETLAKTLCPHLGSKGSIAHDEVQVSSLQENRAQLLDYMELDISLLGDVMLRAKSIYWTRYNVDIGVCLTLSSLAKKIYRMKYLQNMNENEIHEGICGSHQGARTLAKRVLRDGFYWLAYFASRSVIFSESQFEKCQYHSRMTHRPPTTLTSIVT